ncbi:MAG: glycosyltransferase [Planctomycetota bacterium]|jgi:cellulose synthase/poly-beta-1,6-N-acetylglucosamine synthase-like glycosyltransferase|nr:glycosyltransferase [Planctomycetota bacterium]
MYTSLLLIITTVSLSILGLYCVAYIAISVIHIFLARKQEQERIPVAEDITILVPSLNEGKSLIDTIESLRKQDIKSTLFIDVLIKDKTDTSFAHLKQRYKGFLYNEFFKISKNRRLRLHATGLQLKNEKVNAVAKTVQTKYVAFLDADHRATKSWLSDSINVLAQSDTKIVQSKRSPLSLSNIFKLWDSLQNHIGNEVVNRFLSLLGHTTYFTGTTCVFETELIRDQGLPDSITEDTYLSYQMFSRGEKISYNAKSGSYEEMAPDVFSYIARRRRWSCGHNQTLKDFCFKIISWSGFSLKEKTQMAFHLFFFFLPVIILVQQLFYGLYFSFQYSRNVQYFALGTSLILSCLLCLLAAGNRKQYFQNLVLAFLWTFPFISILSVHIYKFLGNETFYLIAPLPYAKNLFYIHLGFLASPLLILITGTLVLKRPTIWHFVGVVLTYPVVLFIDIFASLLGILDLILKRRRWSTIARSSDIDNDIEDLAYTVTGRRRRRNLLLVTGLPSLLVLSILFNDLMAHDNCGYKQHLFGFPLLIHLDSRVVTHNSIKKQAIGDKIQVSIETKISNPMKTPLRIAYIVGGIHSKEHRSRARNFSTKFSGTFPMGWDYTKAIVTIKGDGVNCVQKTGFNTTHVEFRSNTLYVNKEPFLIKGLIPSHNEHKSGISWEEGLIQIKNAGSNMIRIYHEPSEDILRLCHKHNMLIMSQPDQSTWDNFDITSSRAIDKYSIKFRKYIHALDGHPSNLIFNLGNELEIGTTHERSIPNLYKLINNVAESSFYRFPTTYSTFLTYLNHPADILSINMLDSGSTYWEDAIQMLGTLGKPFIASEFGGFVAFYERVNYRLRIERMYRYWNRLLANRAAGAFFYQSHDNWAQHVPRGYNDPFSPEQPDDTRGYWTQDNKEKPALYHLKQIFCDLKFRVVKIRKAGVLIEAQNIRPYALAGLFLNTDQSEFSLGTIAPNERVTFTVPAVEVVDNAFHFELKYSTHRGLKQHFVHRYSLDKKKNTKEVRFLPLHQEYRTGKSFLPLKKNLSVRGPVVLKVRVPEIPPGHQGHLVFDGIGCVQMTFVDQNQNPLNTITCHAYREIFVTVQSIRKHTRNGFLYIKLNRNATTFISAKYSPNGKAIDISFRPIKLLLVKQ